MDFTDKCKKEFLQEKITKKQLDNNVYGSENESHKCSVFENCNKCKAINETKKIKEEGEESNSFTTGGSAELGQSPTPAISVVGLRGNTTPLNLTCPKCNAVMIKGICPECNYKNEKKYKNITEELIAMCQNEDADDLKGLIQSIKDQLKKLDPKKDQGKIQSLQQRIQGLMAQRQKDIERSNKN